MNKFIVAISILLPIICATFANGFTTANYELVSIEWPKQHKRSALSTIPISLKVFNTRIDLNLKPVDDIIINPNTPVYNIERSNYQLLVKKNKIFNDIKVAIYEDEKNFASVVVNIYPNGIKAIENAIIGVNNLIIRPATESLLSRLGKNHTRHDINHLYVVYTRKEPVGHFLNPLERLTNAIDRTYFHRPLSLPNVIYPEVLVIVDYYLAKNLGKDSVVPYVLAFWNQVDLMYRSLNNPKYRINIAGIVIPKNLKAVDFISNVRAQFRSSQLNFQDVLNQSFRWLYIHQKSIPIYSYDIAITMTSTQSESANNLNGLLFGQEIGLATVSSACEVDHDSKNVLKSGIILDNGDFTGVSTGAHELGHTLGAYHDNSPFCAKTDGYLMSPTLSSTIHRFEWSKCTLKYFKDFLNTNPQCLFNKPI